MTVVIVTHNREISRVADRVIELSSGGSSATAPRPTARSPSTNCTGSGVLLLRWTWRDLRARWLQVAAIALIIAIGSGTYSGLTQRVGVAPDSYDASYAALNMYDLRVDLAEGSTVRAARLLRVLGGAVGHDLDEVEARLDAPVQVDASTADETILVPGTLSGSTWPTAAHSRRPARVRRPPVHPGRRRGG